MSVHAMADYEPASVIRFAPSFQEPRATSCSWLKVQKERAPGFGSGMHLLFRISLFINRFLRRIGVESIEVTPRNVALNFLARLAFVFGLSDRLVIYHHNPSGYDQQVRRRRARALSS